MRKLSTYFWAIPIILLLSLFPANADITRIIGEHTTTSGFPFRRFYHDARSTYLIKASELGENFPGAIGKISLKLVKVGRGYTYNGFTIKMQNTNINDLQNEVHDGWTTVFISKPVTLPTVGGWFTLEFDNFFHWDKKSNLLIQFCFDNRDWKSDGETVAAHQAPGSALNLNSDNSEGCNPQKILGVSNQDIRPQLKLHVATSVIDIKPSMDEVLKKGEIYADPDKNHPSFQVASTPANKEKYVEYIIAGPGKPGDPDYQVIYEGLDEVTPNETKIDIQSLPDITDYRIKKARGIAAEPATGALDLQTNANQIRGGEYTVTAKLYIPSKRETPFISESKFNIALEKDFGIVSINYPRKGDVFELSRGISSNVITVRNLGLETINAFDVYSEEYFFDEENKDWELVQRDTVKWRANEGSNSPLKFKDKTSIRFPKNVIFNKVGKYKVEYKGLPFYTVGVDFDNKNNILPRANADIHYFDVTHPVEVFADKVTQPLKSEKYYKGVPIEPKYQVGNNGFSDTTGVECELRINWVNPTNNFYELQGGVMKANSSDIVRRGIGFVTFPFFEPKKEGMYVLDFTISSANDPVPTNNTLRDTFYVQKSLAGEYTLGREKAGDPRNFNSFEEFANIVLENGIEGPMTIYLTDAEYNIGERAKYFAPAVDLSGSIVGASKANYIKFLPAQNRYYEKGAVKINILAQSGVGFYFGQNDLPSNPNSAVYKVNSEMRRNFTNPRCGFVFDGGPYKALQFNMNTKNKKRIALYFGPGSFADTVRNCVFTDVNPVETNEALVPLSYFDSKLSMYLFDKDSTATGTYSAAIVSRSHRPVDTKADNYLNNFNMDTLVNYNNVFEKNEISGFAYGIMSMGVGPLFEQGPGKLKEFMNYSNKIVSNEIYNVKRAGIFVGFEDNCLIKNNVIYDVTGKSAIKNSAGIIAGGEARGGSGYYNTNLTIDGNEIYRVFDDDAAYGILVEGPVNKYSDGYSLIEMPAKPENIKIYNNAIREMIPRNANTYLFGLTVQSGRLVRNSHTKIQNFLTSSDPRFRVRDVLVANNTIVMKNDKYKNTGVITNLALMNLRNARVLGNALAMLDTDIDVEKSTIASLVTMEGYFPFRPGYISDRNAFEIGTNSPASVYRFFETDSANRIVEFGYHQEYKTLEQWRNWTFQDMNSFEGSFYDDITENRNGHYYSMRVRTNPYPHGSILNNNGPLLPGEVTHDIDGNERGIANQRNDIGACEFAGTLYSEDLSVENIIEPRRYQAGKGIFADAQYVMQNPPFRVESVVRNNGMLPRSDVTIRTYLFLEAADGTYIQVDSVDSKIYIASEKEANIVCNFPSSFDTLFPRSFSDFIKFANEEYASTADAARAKRLFNYQVPAIFKGMEHNVTPRYKIRVQIMVAEQRADNDYFEKYVRYYLPKSKTGMAVTGEHIAADLSNETDKDIIAGKLNFDAVVKSLEDNGYSRHQDSLATFDVFNRNSWESRAVNYDVFNTIFWADGDDKALTKYQVQDIRNFLSTYGAYEAKRNLIISSQEMAREITNPNNYQKDIAFAESVLRAVPASNKSPLVDDAGNYLTYHGKRVQGVSLQMNNLYHTETIERTGVQYDAEPLPGNLVKPNIVGDAVVYPAFRYLTVTNKPQENTMGMASVSLMTNTLYLGVDWRHYTHQKILMKAILDFIQKNGGNEMVPVELADFDAVKVNNQVQVAWKTIYELNSNRFELERATENESGTSAFSVIETVKAGNTSSTVKEYGPFIDRNVSVGNTYIYRLKMIDNDGSYSYSNEVAVEFGNGELSIIKVQPNPVETNATITFNIAERNRVDVSLFDINGRKVQTIFSKVAEPGNNTAIIDATVLSSGTYSIVITDGNSTITKQIVIKK